MDDSWGDNLIEIGSDDEDLEDAMCNVGLSQYIHSYKLNFYFICFSKCHSLMRRNYLVKMWRLQVLVKMSRLQVRPRL